MRVYTKSRKEWGRTTAPIRGGGYRYILPDDGSPPRRLYYKPRFERPQRTRSPPLYQAVERDTVRSRYIPGHRKRYTRGPLKYGWRYSLDDHLLKHGWYCLPGDGLLARQSARKRGWTYIDSDGCEQHDHPFGNETMVYESTSLTAMWFDRQPKGGCMQKRGSLCKIHCHYCEKNALLAGVNRVWGKFCTWWGRARGESDGADWTVEVLDGDEDVDSLDFESNIGVVSVLESSDSDSDYSDSELDVESDSEYSDSELDSEPNASRNSDLSNYVSRYASRRSTGPRNWGIGWY